VDVLVLAVLLLVVVVVLGARHGVSHCVALFVMRRVE